MCFVTFFDSSEFMKCEDKLYLETRNTIYIYIYIYIFVVKKTPKAKIVPHKM
jgi:hypothetical protein